MVAGRSSDRAGMGRGGEKQQPSMLSLMAKKYQADKSEREQLQQDDGGLREEEEAVQEKPVQHSSKMAMITKRYKDQQAKAA